MSDNISLGRQEAISTYNTPKEKSLDSDLVAQCKTLVSRKLGILLTGLEKKIYSNKVPEAVSNKYTVGSINSRNDLHIGDYWSYTPYYHDSQKVYSFGHAGRIMYGKTAKGELTSDLSKAVKVGIFESVGEMGHRIDPERVGFDEDKSYYYHRPTGDWFELETSGSITVERLGNVSHIQIGENGTISTFGIITERSIGYVTNKSEKKKRKDGSEYTLDRYPVFIRDKNAIDNEEYITSFMEASHELHEQQMKENVKPTFYSGNVAINKYRGAYDLNKSIDGKDIFSSVEAASVFMKMLPTSFQFHGDLHALSRINNRIKLEITHNSGGM